MIDIRLSDNLELMAEIKDNTVDLIYCDILYGTGRKFDDYQDLKPKRELIEEHYIPRVKEMHRILKDTGSIYLQMDTKINHWMRCILDDIFGYNRFLNEVVWCYRWGSRHKNKWNSKHDIILLYSKSKKWTFNADEVREEYAKNSAMTKNKKYNKSYNEKGALPRDIINLEIINSMSTEKTGYNTQKPKKLIEKLIKASSNEGDLVADFYAGSFTTAEVCGDLKRNFIGCDISEKAVEIGKSRVAGFLQ